eukprot:TRINITY_DN995_c0_g1_i1.p1 TRINITY_DN995_c0_g1~~TRINITY_DN995_c0_g1_i1.p1  ORF type:complete len:377 (+),score=50.98 TRINITY_DN995_c0_g1_i1:73-1203(+)
MWTSTRTLSARRLTSSARFRRSPSSWSMSTSSMFFTTTTPMVMHSDVSTRSFSASRTTFAPPGGAAAAATGGGGMGKVVGAAAVIGAAAYYGYEKFVNRADDPVPTPAKKPAAKPAVEEAPSALVADQFVKFPLEKAIELSHDTKIYRFKLPSEDHKLGLPVASCLVTKGPGPEGKDIVRPYTPITSDKDTRGHFDLLIKVYDKGNMSRYIDSLKPGDSLEVKGPISKLPYQANMKKNISMIAGGTGITPMYQVLRAILDNPEDKTKVSLIFCNKSQEDILMKDVLDGLAKKHSNFKVHYIVDKSDGPFDGDIGYITEKIIKKHTAEPSDDSLVLVCGPPGFYNVVSGGKTPDYKQGELKGFLKELGFTEEQVFKF